MKMSRVRAVVAVAAVTISAALVGACTPAPVAPTPVPDIEFARTDATSVNIDVDEGLGFVGFVTGVQSQPIGSAISAEGTGSISSSDCATPDPDPFFDRIGYAIWVVGTNPAVRLAFVEAACGQSITLDVPLHGYSPGDTIVVQTAPRSPEARNLKVTFSIRLSAPVFTPVSI